MKKILKTGTLAMAVSLTAFMTSCGDFLDCLLYTSDAADD